MKERFWRLVARIVTHPRIRKWLILRAMRTPYSEIPGADGEHVYMERFWLFNPYDDNNRKRYPFLPSIRLNHIRRADLDGHPHSHPWPWRTILLDEWYVEERLTEKGNRVGLMRETGYTGAMDSSDYHRIKCVPLSGVWTMFITYQRVPDMWGFLVDGRHVPHDQYLRDRG